MGLEHIKALETHFNGEYGVNMRTGQTLKWTRNYRNNPEAFHPGRQ